MLALAALCAFAVVDVTLLGGTGRFHRGMGPSVSVGNCVTIQEQRTGCGESDAWYLVTRERPTSDGCSTGRRRSEDERYCLALVHPIKIELGPISTPPR